MCDVMVTGTSGLLCLACFRVIMNDIIWLYYIVTLLIDEYTVSWVTYIMVVAGYSILLFDQTNNSILIEKITLISQELSKEP